MNALPSQSHAARRIALGLCGFFSFINLYSPQAILPLLGAEFRAGPAEIAALMTASTLAIALIAPFVGTVADVLGRKRVIVAAMAVLAIPTMMASFATTLPELIAWRFIQGLALPPIFAVTVAYIGDELPRDEAVAAVGLYTSGASFGGFSGRLVTGVLSDQIGWRYAFDIIAMLTLAGAVAVYFLLPAERRFVRSEGLLESARQMTRHLRNPHLLATYAIGFGVLFNFIAIFTFVSFHLAAPPYSLSPTLLGLIFVTYLVGTAVTPLIGRPVARFGRRRFIIGVILVWIGGATLTLASPLWLILIGLGLCAGCGMLCQAVSTSYVTTTAQAGRSSAVGLYVTSFYVGGSFGAALGGIAWSFGKYAACIAMVVIMQLLMATIVAVFWQRSDQPATVTPVEPP